MARSRRFRRPALVAADRPVRLGQDHLGQAAFRRQRGRLVGCPAGRRRQRRRRSRCLGRCVRGAGRHRRGPAATRIDHGHRHPRTRCRPPRGRSSRSAAPPGCRWSRCGSAPPSTSAEPATGCGIGRSRRRCCGPSSPSPRRSTWPRTGSTWCSPSTPAARRSASDMPTRIDDVQTCGRCRAERGRPAGLRFALQISSFPWGQDPRSWLGAVATAAERAGFRRHRGDGPPAADPAGRAGLGSDPGGLRHARLSGRGDRTDRAGRTGHPGDVSLGAPAGQDPGQPGRGLRRPGVLRDRRRLVRARTCRLRPAVPVGAGATGRTGVDHRGAQGVLGSRHQTVRRSPGKHLLPTARRRFRSSSAAGASDAPWRSPPASATAATCGPRCPSSTTSSRSCAAMPNGPVARSTSCG